VPFAKSDIDQIKKLASKNLPPGLRVLGFKRMETLKIHERVDRSYFIYPDPTRADTGGRPALVALHAACLKKNLFALCELIIRVDTIPRMCALIPQLQETNGCGEQVKSDGFCLSILPFEDDFRLVVAADGAADGEQVDAAQALITKLQVRKRHARAATRMHTYMHACTHAHIHSTHSHYTAFPFTPPFPFVHTVFVVSSLRRSSGATPSATQL